MSNPTKIKIGTCAWAHDDWKGVFYPGHLPDAERLAFYARHLPAVEVDATFYHAPTLRVAAHWAEVTPPDFAFACKLSRAITHENRLRESAKPLAQFLATLAPLGEKLWCVVVQLPPSFRPRRDETALREFVRHLPAGVRFVIEFRHREWHQPRIAHLLEEHDVTWVWNDLTSLDDQARGAFEFLPDTTDFLYLRLMGDLEKKYGLAERETYDRVRWPRQAALESWAVRLRQAAETHERVFVAINNHFEGYAPETARRIGELLNVPVGVPKLARSEQRFLDESQLDLL